MAEKVLVVEDNPVNALLVATILERLGGFAVVCSTDGEEVLRLVEEAGLAAVVMDVSLEGTSVAGQRADGVDLTRRIRALPAGRHLPVILLTAHAMRGDRERFLFASGANDYVAKPIVDQNAFLQVVRQQISSAAELRTSDDSRPRRAPGELDRG